MSIVGEFLNEHCHQIASPSLSFEVNNLENTVLLMLNELAVLRDTDLTNKKEIIKEKRQDYQQTIQSLRQLNQDIHQKCNIIDFQQLLLHIDPEHQNPWFSSFLRSRQSFVLERVRLAVNVAWRRSGQHPSYNQQQYEQISAKILKELQDSGKADRKLLQQIDKMHQQIENQHFYRSFRMELLAGLNILISNLKEIQHSIQEQFDSQMITEGAKDLSVKRHDTDDQFMVKDQKISTNKIGKKRSFMRRQSFEQNIVSTLSAQSRYVKNAQTPMKALHDNLQQSYGTRSSRNWSRH